MEELPDVEPSTSSSTSNTVSYSPLKMRPYKSLPRNQFPPICVICGHPSTGYHYDVPSCNGCKSFFRRAVISASRFECHTGNDCFDNKQLMDSTRLSCRGCRFQKCVQVGMNPIGIHYSFNEASKTLMAEIREKQADVELELKRMRESPVQTLKSPDESINHLISKLNAVEIVASRIHDTCLPEGLWDLRSLEDILASNMIQSTSKIANLERVSEHDKSSTPVLFAHASFLASVEYATTFDFYANISSMDKLKLARHVTVACSTLHDAFFSMYHMKSDRPVFPNGVTIGEKKPNDESAEFFSKTLVVMLRNRMDRVEYMLLKAIVMCNPAVCSLSHGAQTLLEKERRQYAHCLLQYCRLQHGALNGPSRYAELLSTVPILENQVKLLKDMHTFVTTVLVPRGETFFFTRLFCEALS